MSSEVSPAAAIAAVPVRRRSVLKWSAVAGAGVAAAGAAAKFGFIQAANAGGPKPGDGKFVWSSCNVNCGSRCPLRLQVVDGTIVRVEPENTGDDVIGSQQIRACVRGRAIRQRVYNPDRLKYPMKRVGKRGEGKFERISWDEAFTAIASSLKSTIAKYGNEAVYVNYATGANATMARMPGTRLFNLMGGYLGFYNSYSTAQISVATPYVYGTNVSGNGFEDIVNSKLVVLWGHNPMETRMSGGGQTFVLEQSKKLGGAKVILVDPRWSDTGVTMADEWVPLRPGSDAALVAAMAHVMINENLHDQAFLDTYCVGFDEDHMPEGVPANSSYKSYVMGLGPDGIEKTPQWAAKITGVPAEHIVTLAREIAQAKPCAIFQGWGPQRHMNGEDTSRAVNLLACITGNPGIAGGGTGAREAAYALPGFSVPGGTNAVKVAIPCFKWTDAIDHGPEMTALKDGVRGADKLKVPIKFFWNYAGNCIINQHSDANRTHKLLQDESKCEMIVVVENHMTPSARYADILLPDTTNVETNDLIGQGQSGSLGYLIATSQAIKPLFECKNAYDIAAGIAEKLGILDKFTEGKTRDDWIKQAYATFLKSQPDAPSFDEAFAMGVWKKKGKTPIALEAFRKDPVASPLTTPSGKIELFSKQLYDLGRKWTLPAGQSINALPVFWATAEGPADTEGMKKHPLQCIGHHYKARTHSSYANSEWLREAHPQMVWINVRDANERGIKDGDRVRVFNDRGTVEIIANVTPRICPGVVSLPQGAWYAPDANGVDKGGCTNTLTTWTPSPLAKGNPQHTNLVQIVKA
jgi:anaerobic dimethyl sulfoxide reductase subunit A